MHRSYVEGNDGIIKKKSNDDYSNNQMNKLSRMVDQHTLTLASR